VALDRERALHRPRHLPGSSVPASSVSRPRHRRACAPRAPSWLRRRAGSGGRVGAVLSASEGAAAFTFAFYARGQINDLGGHVNPCRCRSRANLVNRGARRADDLADVAYLRRSSGR
jgi:hypothetical protein